MTESSIIFLDCFTIRVLNNLNSLRCILKQKANQSKIYEGLWKRSVIDNHFKSIHKGCCEE